MLKLDDSANVLFDPASGRRFDPLTRSWAASPQAPTGKDVSLTGAAEWLQRKSGHPVKQPVSVIGPREASREQLTCAESLGTALARIGFCVVCGGRQGIMEAVCRGVAAAGGISIGLLPESEPDQANPYVTVPLATGIGEARNVLVARAGFCIVAIGESYGTLSEVALGLQFGRPVIGLCGAAQVAGVRQLGSVEQAVEAVAAIALGLTD